MTNTRGYMKQVIGKFANGTLYKYAALLVVIAFLISACSVTKGVSTKQETFDTPELAAKALLKAAQTKDENEINRVLGPNSKTLLHSGNPAEEQAAIESFVAKYEKMNRWVTMTDG